MAGFHESTVDRLIQPPGLVCFEKGVNEGDGSEIRSSGHAALPSRMRRALICTRRAPAETSSSTTPRPCLSRPGADPLVFVFVLSIIITIIIIVIIIIIIIVIISLRAIRAGGVRAVKHPGWRSSPGSSSWPACVPRDFSPLAKKI